MGSLTVDVGLLFWTLLTFACLFLLLARFAFRPIRDILEKREQAIRGSLEKADQARREAERILVKNDEQLSEARTEARKIIDEGHRIVADMTREAHREARREADEMVDEARAEIDRQLQRSLDELKGTVASLSVRIARQVIQEGIDDKRHAQLADDLIERLKEVHARRRS
jgi:F-type H+-transporting ATPase subunit b